MVFRVAQISDTQPGGRTAFFVDNFRRVADAIAERPDLVVNTGDISLDGADHEGELAAARESTPL